ncbi:glycosyltransferase family 4 protein [Rubrivirga litoralis]|uniref:Glycosyltransferase family 4 protein n=1 Tax=Rubrivirga litoralis TaxID=3075598 RepID=A0ABU3BSE3_9BACT|nr:glycosyltransferase family 4 protein [Rubrivirga sp. F394]MDT0632217.1 glycosyltransferase family 4 protein [Rubrivirga sp. F394]
MTTKHATPPRPAPPDLDGTRVLVTLGGIPLWGQERGNIQVFEALRDVGVDALFATHHSYGHESIQPALDGLGLGWTTAFYPGRWVRGKGAGWLAGRFREALQSNRDLLRAARAYRPTHVHTMNERYAVDFLPAFKLLRVPVVYRAGDAPSQHRRIFRFAWRRLIAPSVSRFVAISGFVRDALVEAGVPPEKITVIYNYPPERPPRPEGSDLPADVTAPYSGRTVAYVGQITADKGVDVLVDAALALCAERDDVRFLLAGNYSWKNPFADALRDRVEAAGLSDRVRFLGSVADVPGLLALADVHTAPSVWEEPLGNVVVEAKRAGVPSVVFPSGGIPELVVEDGRDAVLCRDKTPEALTNGLRHFLDLPADALADAGGAARASLEALGITREAFTRAWAGVFAQT